MELAVLALPGTGFDDIFAKTCFSTLAQNYHITIFSATPDPENLITSLEAAIAHKLLSYDLILAGVSISAAIAIDFILKHQSSNNSYPGTIKAIIAAAPAWTANNDASMAPAKLSALNTAHSIYTYGFKQTLENMESTTPIWLSKHMTRSWQLFGEKLATLCQQAAHYSGPNLEQIRCIPIPLVSIGLIDDPIHPCTIAQQWAESTPKGIYRSTSLIDLSHDIGILGRLAAEILRKNLPNGE